MEKIAAPPVSVIIPHYDDLVSLRNCVALLERQTFPRVKFEIIVADNNSPCGLDAVRMAVPTAKVVTAPIQGAGPARNAGVAASQGRVLAFIDSDCAPEPEWLTEGLARLRDFDFIGGKVVTTARDPAKPSPVEAFEMVFNFDFRRYIEKVGFTGTGNMFVTRTVFEQVGGFRNGLSEDMDWSFRARALGYRLGYAEHAVVGHPARHNWIELRKRWARMLPESYLLISERRFGRAIFAFKALAMPLSVLPHALRVLRSPRLPDLTARAGALGVLLRLRTWRAARMAQLLCGNHVDVRLAQAEPSPVRDITAPGASG